MADCAWANRFHSCTAWLPNANRKFTKQNTPVGIQTRHETNAVEHKTRRQYQDFAEPSGPIFNQGTVLDAAVTAWSRVETVIFE